MANIRIKDLPSDSAPNQNDIIPIDLAGTRGATIKDVVESGRPTASKTEAELGVDPQKAMTPLTTKQAIDAQVSVAYVPKTVKVNAVDGLTGGGELSGDVTVGLTTTNIDRLNKVDGIEAGAQVNTVNSVNAKTGNVVLSASDVGLGNVDNTSDASKPISAATQAALDDKANSSVTISAGSGLTGGGTLAANRTIALSSASIASLALADSAVQSVNGKAGSSVTLTKTDVGLGNVDNTSDDNKPVSTATQAALNAKANSSVTITAGDGLTGGGNLTANRSIALNAASIASLEKADTALQAPGGSTGQILAKSSDTDNDVSWVSSEAATAVSYGPQTLTEPQKAQARVNIGVREVLIEDRTYYVRNDGNDTNDGLTNNSSGAFATLQAAYETICDRIDLNGQKVTIQVGNGTFGGLIVRRSLVGNNSILIRGNVTAPSSVIIESFNNHSIMNTAQGMTVDVEGLRLENETAGTCLNAAYGGIVRMTGKCIFGNSAGPHIESSSNGRIVVLADYTIDGDANRHWHAYGLSEIVCQNITITIAKPVTFGRWAGLAGSSVVTCPSLTFVNPENVTTTSERWLIYQNSYMLTNNTNLYYLPGSGIGLTQSGGIYQSYMLSGAAGDTFKGIFTPVIVGSSSAGTGVYTSNSGNFVKIGSAIIFTLEIIVTSHTGTGDMSIVGLPFKALRHSSVSLHCANLTYSGELQGFIGANTDRINLRTRSSGGASLGIPMDTSFSIFVSGSYQTD